MFQFTGKLVLFCAAGLLLEAAPDTFHFDFEQGEGEKLPPAAKHIIGRDEGGTIQIIPAEGIAPYKKALHAAVDGKKPDARMLILRKIQAQSGQMLQFEGRVKGKGIAMFGIYGYRKGGVMAVYRVASVKVDSDRWLPVRKEIILDKDGVVYVYPFLQCNRGSVVFSPFTVSVKGMSSGFLDRKQRKSNLSWKICTPSGNLTPGKEQSGKNGMFLQLDTETSPMGIASEELPAKAGESVFVTYQAKGKGSLGGGLIVAGEKSKGQSVSAENETLSEQWKEYRFQLLVPNGRDFETRKAQIQFQLSRHSHARIRNIHVYWKECQYAGDLPFPAEAVVFPLLPNSFMPSINELTQIPASLGGVKPVKVTLNNGLVDLAVPMNGVKLKNCAWVYYRITSPMACDYTLGAGADWWMTLYLNGKTVLDTSRSGNNGSDCSLLDQTAAVRLRKGENILAVKFESGRASSILTVGGPNEIRLFEKNIERTGTPAIDDYSDSSVRRPGSPRYVKRITMPGNMTMDQVGLYRESCRLDPFRQDFSFDSEGKWTQFGQSALLVEFPSRGDGHFFSYGFCAGEKELRCVVFNKKEQLYFFLEENGKRVSPEILVGNGKKMLPCDFTVYTDRQGCIRAFFSSRKNARYYKKILWNSPLMKQIADGKFRVHARIGLPQKESVIALDDYAVVTGKIKEEQKNIPFLLDQDESFDPVKAGWPLVMEDDFNGTVIDTKKWKVDGRKDPRQTSITLDGKGLLVIKADWNKEKTRLVTRRLWSRRTFRYGYFEARLRFTKQPGWWSSFFMMSPLPSGTAFHGVEFDFYEDYYTRPEHKGASFRNILDSTAYVGYPRAYKHPSKIWNYHSRIPGSLDDFYTLGVKWTPFQISYYLNGKRLPGFLKFSPHSTVTFDAFNHAAIACGTQMIFAGEIGMGNAKDGKFPEYFLVDYFRAYAMPQDELPGIQWVGEKKRNLFVKKGEVLNFEVQVSPSPKTKSPVRGVYLFDNGYFIAKKETPPYTFSIPMTEEFYKTTQYFVPGLSKGTPMNPPVFEGPFPHTFAAFVQDEKGQVSLTSFKRYILQEEKPSTPYQGKAQVIPGIVHLPFYDEGGQDAAYNWAEKGGRDQTFRKNEKVYATKHYVENHQACNYLKFTVDVKKAGKYDVTFRYACVSPVYTDSWAKLYVDGMEAAHFQLENAGTYSKPSQRTKVSGVFLPAGRHKLLVMLNLEGFAADLDFQPAK